MRGAALKLASASCAGRWRGCLPCLVPTEQRKPCTFLPLQRRAHECKEAELDTRTRVLRAIIAFRDEKGYPPTLREVAKACGIGLSTTAHHVDVLIDAGVLRRDRGVARSLVVAR